MSNILNEYVKKPTTRRSDLAEVMDRMHNEKLDELEDIKIDAKIAEEKKKLKEASPPTADSSQAPNFMTFLSSLFVGKSSAEIQEILTFLTQEQIDKLKYLSESMNPNNLANLRGMMQPQSSNLKETIEIVKLILSMQQPQQPTKSESNNISGKDLIEAFKTGLEVKVQQPANPQNDFQYKLYENSMAEAKAAREEAKAAREEASRERILKAEKEIADIRNRPSGFDELVNNEEKAAKVRKIFGGTDSGVANEFTLRKGEMDQTERLETKKLDWEMKKWELEKDKEGSTLETVKEILAGPAGDILKTLGGAGADRIRGNKSNSSSASQAQSPQIVKVNCPSCKGIFAANNQLSTVQCPLCGTQLQNGNQPPATPQEQQASAPAQEQSKPPEPQVSSKSTQASSEVETTVKKPIDETVEAESPVEPITTKQ